MDPGKPISVIEERERAKLLKDLKKELRKQIYAASIRLELAERGALVPQELSYTELAGMLVKIVRQIRGLTQAELSRRTGLAAETINRLEAGVQKPHQETLNKLSEGLKVPVGQLDPYAVFGDTPGFLEAQAKEMREFVKREKELREQEEARA